MKTLIIPDIHGRDFWKALIKQENPDKVIFLGDYFDSYDLSSTIQIYNFKEIIEYKKTSGKEVILLIGNHDFHYFPGIKTGGATSGYQEKFSVFITMEIENNKEHLQMCYENEGYLFSHAGISAKWLEDVGYEGEEISSFVNEMWKHKPYAFDFFGFNSYGEDICQTPIWIRPKSLMKSNKKGAKNSLKEKYIQIVGHTQVDQIDFKGKTTGKRYYFVDTFGKKEGKIDYLIIEDKELKLKIYEK